MDVEYKKSFLHQCQICEIGDFAHLCGADGSTRILSMHRSHHAFEPTYVSYMQLKRVFLARSFSMHNIKSL